LRSGDRMRKIKLFLIGTAAALLAGIDNEIKECVERDAINNGVIKHTNGFAEIEKHHNKGLPLNKFDNHTKEITAISAAVLTLQALNTGEKALKDDDGISDIANALILGGALSNTYDRIRRGYVVDYLKVGRKRAIYNISDFMIISGVLLSLINSIFKKDN